MRQHSEEEQTEVEIWQAKTEIFDERMRKGQFSERKIKWNLGGKKNEVKI